MANINLVTFSPGMFYFYSLSDGSILCATFDDASIGDKYMLVP